jgi:hypothetical protein
MRASLSAVVLALALASGAPAADPGEKCAAAKLRAAAQKTSALLECRARALQAPAAPDTACTTRVQSKFAAKWARIESRGGCAVSGDGDDVEARIDAFVADLVDAVPATTTTTTTTTTPATCPPTTALYCGQSGCGFGALCPAGMTCDTSTCACVGPAVACGSISGNLCRWGTCPPGMTCGTDPTSTACPPACACH